MVSSYLPEAEYNQMTQNWKEFKEELFGSSFTVADYAVASLIGLVATGAHELLVAMPSSNYNTHFAKSNGHLNIKTDGVLTEQINQSFNNVLDSKTITKLEQNHKVSFDEIKGHSGLSGTTHRSRTPGHDPLIGLIFGVKDIMTGQLTKVVNGQIIVDPTSVDPITNIFKAVKTWAGHMLSDINTKASLPLPGSTFIDWLSGGSYMDQLYRMGMNIKHLFAQAIPVVISDILVRLYCLYKGYASTLGEAFSPIPKTKVRRIVLLMHTVNLTANVVITCTLKGCNPTNINWAAVFAVGWYTVQEAFHWIINRWKEINNELAKRETVIENWIKKINLETNKTITLSKEVCSDFDKNTNDFDESAAELAALLSVKF